MALRQEDLEFQGGPEVGALVYRFPTERAEAARIRAGIRRRRAARRRHRAGLAAVALAVVGLTIFGGGQEATAPAAQKTKRVAIVSPGDTLWDIAERHAPEGMDPRVYVDFLIRANDVGAVLQPGMRLRLP